MTRAAARLALNAAALAAGALAIWALFERAGLDRAIAALFYDPAARRFPLQHDWFLTRVAHDGLKWAVLSLWAGLVLVALLPLERLRRWRTSAARAALGMAAIALAVSGLKQASAHSCPWDLADYGGTAQWFALLAAVPPGAGPGRCLPAGHAAVGFALFALYFALRLERPAAARAWLGAAWAVGLIAAAAQVARGAHFASHALWTAAIAWGVGLLVDLLLRRLNIR